MNDDHAPPEPLIGMQSPDDRRNVAFGCPKLINARVYSRFRRTRPRRQKRSDCAQHLARCCGNNSSGNNSNWAPIWRASWPSWPMDILPHLPVRSNR